MDVIDEYIKGCEDPNCTLQCSPKFLKKRKGQEKKILDRHYYEIQRFFQIYCKDDLIQSYDKAELFFASLYEWNYDFIKGCKDLIFKSVLDAIMDNPWCVKNYDKHFFNRIKSQGSFSVKDTLKKVKLT